MNYEEIQNIIQEDDYIKIEMMIIEMEEYPIFDEIVDGFNISTLLEYVIIKDNIQLVRLLIGRNHNINYSNFKRPLELAIYLKNFMISKILMDSGAEITEEIIKEAINAGEEFVKLLMSR
jgi:hypothetical protein